MLGILTSLAGFSLRKPKTLLAIIAVTVFLAAAVHYKVLVAERDKLRIAEIGYKAAVTAFVAREASLQEDIQLEREAARIALVERNDARMVLDFFRSSRNDAPSIQWANLTIPEAEMKRLCIALPRMNGCQ